VSRSYRNKKILPARRSSKQASHNTSFGAPHRPPYAPNGPKPSWICSFHHFCVDINNGWRGLAFWSMRNNVPNTGVDYWNYLSPDPHYLSHLTPIVASHWSQWLFWATHMMFWGWMECVPHWHLPNSPKIPGFYPGMGRPHGNGVENDQKMKIFKLSQKCSHMVLMMFWHKFDTYYTSDHPKMR
jgi:hypothetical protein